MTNITIQHRPEAVTDGACATQCYLPHSKRLPLSVEMQEGETATSLCSRQSAINGLPRMQTLCRDFLIGFKKLCNGDREAVQRVAELTGADPEILAAHTPCLIEPGWFQLGCERLKFTAMLRNGGQLCPLCIAEDECRDPRFGPWQRDIWQVGAFRRCPTHGVAFERPKFACQHWQAHDFFQVLKTWAPGKIVHVQVGHHDTVLDTYLLQRLENGAGNDWIDRQAFHAVWLFSEALGTLLTQGPKARIAEQSVHALIRAGAIGFEIMRGGPEAILAVLIDIRDQAGRDRNSYGKLYGPVLSCLLEHRKDPDFDELRHLVRNFIQDNFWIPAGTSLLGEICEHPKVFNTWTASRHFDVPISLLTRQLRHEGRLTAEHPNNKCDPTLLFPREEMEATVAVVRKLSSLAVTRAVLGANRYTMEQLCAVGLLPPHFTDDGGLPVYHHDEVMKFLKALQERVIAIQKPSRYWKPVTSAASRTHCSTVWIIQQVLNGHLDLKARLPNPFQLSDFMVSTNQLRSRLQVLPEGMVTVADAAKWIAADVRTVHALADEGYLPWQMADNRLANRPRRLFAKADLETFAHRYTVLRALNGARKAHYTSTLTFIAEQGLSPILKPEGLMPIFERGPLERIARIAGGEQLARLMAVEDTRLRQQPSPSLQSAQNEDMEGAA